MVRILDKSKLRGLNFPRSPPKEQDGKNPRIPAALQTPVIGPQIPATVVQTPVSVIHTPATARQTPATILKTPAIPRTTPGTVQSGRAQSGNVPGTEMQTPVDKGVTFQTPVPTKSVPSTHVPSIEKTSSTILPMTKNAPMQQTVTPIVQQTTNPVVGVENSTQKSNQPSTPVVQSTPATILKTPTVPSMLMIGHDGIARSVPATVIKKDDDKIAFKQEREETEQATVHKRIEQIQSRIEARFSPDKTRHSPYKHSSPKKQEPGVAKKPQPEVLEKPMLEKSPLLRLEQLLSGDPRTSPQDDDVESVQEQFLESLQPFQFYPETRRKSPQTTQHRPQHETMQTKLAKKSDMSQRESPLGEVAMKMRKAKAGAVDEPNAVQEAGIIDEDIPVDTNSTLTEKQPSPRSTKEGSPRLRRATLPPTQKRDMWDSTCAGSPQGQRSPKDGSPKSIVGMQPIKLDEISDTYDSRPWREHKNGRSPTSSSSMSDSSDDSSTEERSSTKSTSMSVSGAPGHAKSPGYAKSPLSKLDQYLAESKARRARHEESRNDKSRHYSKQKIRYRERKARGERRDHERHCHKGGDEEKSASSSETSSSSASSSSASKSNAATPRKPCSEHKKLKKDRGNSPALRASPIRSNLQVSTKELEKKRRKLEKERRKFEKTHRRKRRNNADGITPTTSTSSSTDSSSSLGNPFLFAPDHPVQQTFHEVNKHKHLKNRYQVPEKDPMLTTLGFSESHVNRPHALDPTSLSHTRARFAHLTDPSMNQGVYQNMREKGIPPNIKRIGIEKGTHESQDALLTQLPRKNAILLEGVEEIVYVIRALSRSIPFVPRLVMKYRYALEDKKPVKTYHSPKPDVLSKPPPVAESGTGAAAEFGTMKMKANAKENPKQYHVLFYNEPDGSESDQQQQLQGEDQFKRSGSDQTGKLFQNQAEPSFLYYGERDIPKQAEEFEEKAYGMVLHDQQKLRLRSQISKIALAEAVQTIWELESALVYLLEDRSVVLRQLLLQESRMEYIKREQLDLLCVDNAVLGNGLGNAALVNGTNEIHGSAESLSHVMRTTEFQGLMSLKEECEARIDELRQRNYAITIQLQEGDCSSRMILKKAYAFWELYKVPLLGGEGDLMDSNLSQHDVNMITAMGESMGDDPNTATGRVQGTGTRGMKTETEIYETDNALNKLGKKKQLLEMLNDVLEELMHVRREYVEREEKVSGRGYATNGDLGVNNRLGANNTNSSALFRWIHKKKNDNVATVLATSFRDSRYVNNPNKHQESLGTIGVESELKNDPIANLLLRKIPADKKQIQYQLSELEHLQKKLDFRSLRSLSGVNSYAAGARVNGTFNIQTVNALLADGFNEKYFGKNRVGVVRRAVECKIQDLRFAMDELDPRKKLKKLQMNRMLAGTAKNTVAIERSSSSSSCSGDDEKKKNVENIAETNMNMLNAKLQNFGNVVSIVPPGVATVKATTKISVKTKKSTQHTDYGVISSSDGGDQ